MEDRRRQADALGRPGRRTAVFRIAAGRHAFEARTLLGERFAGIVCSDRWRGYDYLDPSRRHLCGVLSANIRGDPFPALA